MSKTYTSQEVWDLIDAGLSDLKEKMIEQVNKTQLGAGEAVDLTSKAIQLAQIDAGVENVKHYVKRKF